MNPDLTTDRNEYLMYDNTCFFPRFYSVGGKTKQSITLITAPKKRTKFKLLKLNVHKFTQSFVKKNLFEPQKKVKQIPSTCIFIVYTF